MSILSLVGDTSRFATTFFFACTGHCGSDFFGVLASMTGLGGGPLFGITTRVVIFERGTIEFVDLFTSKRSRHSFAKLFPICISGSGSLASRLASRSVEFGLRPRRRFEFGFGLLGGGGAIGARIDSRLGGWSRSGSHIDELTKDVRTIGE